MVFSTADSFKEILKFLASAFEQLYFITMRNRDTRFLEEIEYHLVAG